MISDYEINSTVLLNDGNISLKKEHFNALWTQRKRSYQTNLRRMDLEDSTTRWPDKSLIGQGDAWHCIQPWPLTRYHACCQVINCSQCEVLGILKLVIKLIIMFVYKRYNIIQNVWVISEFRNNGYTPLSLYIYLLRWDCSDLIKNVYTCNMYISHVLQTRRNSSTISVPAFLAAKYMYVWDAI